MRWILAVVTVALTFALAPGTRSQTKAKTEPGGHALSTVRLVNTAEAYAHQAQGRYVSLAELVSTGVLKRAAEMNDDFTSTFSELDPQKGAGLLNGFDFAIVVSSDGGTYKLSLAAKERCGTAYFTDDRGMIYSGRVLGCSAQEAASSSDVL